MRIVFWLDPNIGFDWNTPEIITNFADGLAGMGYDVELLVESQVLDAFPLELAVRRVWFENTDQQVVSDVLISNRLDWLLRDDLYQAGERIWLAIGRDLATALQQYETYQLHEEIRVLALTRQRKDELAEAGVPAVLVRPGIRFDKCKGKAGKARENPCVTIGLFDPRPELIRLILQGVEMTRVAMAKLEVQIFTDREMEIKATLPIQVKVKPTLEERIRAYERSDIVIYIPGAERTALMPLEAMAAGVPVILPQHPALAEYEKNRQNSLMLGKLHPKGLALAILNIMKIGNVREQLKSQAVQTAQDYDLKQSLLILCQLWNSPGMTKIQPAPEENPGGEELEVDFVILNRDSGEELAGCLATLKEYMHHPYRTIIVDTGSDDEQLKALKEEPGICLIHNQQDNGIARACNQGILAGKGKYILLAPVPVRFSSGWFEPLFTELLKPEVAMVFPQILSDSPETEQVEPVQSSQTSPTHVFIIKRACLNRLGLLDEAFTLSYADLDYSLRVEEKGYQVVHCLDSILHLPAPDTSGENEETSAKRTGEIAQNRRSLRDKWGELRPESKPVRQGDGVVVFGLLPWQKRAERTEALLEFLHQQGQKVVYVEPYCANRIPEQPAPGQYLYSCKGSGTVYHNLTNPGRRVEMTHELKRQLAQWGIKAPVLWMEAAWWEPFLQHIEHRLLVYITPEILLGEEMETYQQLKEKFSKSENVLLKAADLVVAGTEKRMSELQGQVNHLIFCPGGFFPAELDRYMNGHYTMPAEITRLEGVKVGITGTVNRFFPKHLLRELARKHPEVSFLFVGEITCELGDLAKLPNLYFLGNKGWDYLLDCLYFCDLVLYPYQARGLMAYADPSIVNYYLALGKPVIAFKHAELESFAGVISCAESEQEFGDMVTQALGSLEDERSEAKIRERLARVRGHSWEERMAEVLDNIANVLPAPQIQDLTILVKELPAVDKENPLLNIWKQIQKRLGRKSDL